MWASLTDWPGQYSRKLSHSIRVPYRVIVRAEPLENVIHTDQVRRRLPMFKRLGFSRRVFLRDSVGVAAAWELQRAAWAVGFSHESPVCNTVAAEQEVGPYYVADELVRSDV